MIHDQSCGGGDDVRHLMKAWTKGVVSLPVKQEKKIKKANKNNNLICSKLKAFHGYLQ